jgi:hypothetical protein
VSAAALAGALDEIRAALERGDGAAAALAVQRGLEACAELARRGARLPAVTVAELREAVTACLDRALAERERLAGALVGAARSRRAADAYGAGGGKPGRNCPP